MLLGKIVAGGLLVAKAPGVLKLLPLPPHVKLGISAVGTTVLLIKGLKAKPYGLKTLKEDASGEQLVNISWHNVTCKLEHKKKGTRRLLNKVNGSANAGKLTALMGPSGSGKTTLLNVLAGQLPKQNNLSLEGSLLFNGSPNSSHKQAYMKQDDVFYAQMTVRETLLTTARLLLPSSMSLNDKKALVEGLITKLSLRTCADSIVGSVAKRGISGGERKRLNLACELIGKPAVVFADEPTTGLDAFQAEKVMECLHALAEEGKTVLTVIHQPGSSIWELLDNIILINEGHVMFSGTTTEALEWFARQGHPCPSTYNPAEFCVRLISIDHSSSENEAASRKRISKLAEAWAAHVVADNQKLVDGYWYAEKAAAAGWKEVVAKNPVPQCEATPMEQLGLLFRRAWREVLRDSKALGARMGSQIGSAIIYSCIWKLGLTQSHIKDRLGLLQIVAIGTAMQTSLKTLGVFAAEKVIVDGERAKGQYNAGPYFASKVLAEMPVGAAFPCMFSGLVYPLCGLSFSLTKVAKFLTMVIVESFTSSSVGMAISAVTPSGETAAAVGPTVMVVFIVFSGLYVTDSNIPRPLRWLPKVSCIRWAWEGLSVNELQGLEFETDGKPSDIHTGEEMIDRLGLTSWSHALAREAQILIFNYGLTYYMLRAALRRVDSAGWSSQHAFSEQRCEEWTGAVEQPARLFLGAALRRVDSAVEQPARLF
ncbi:hypothetical protein CYMTET_3297 [Cymbomonas tetramitiformis]|uniref:ABC transporter domain-containing protein n=1 Tax=Cymbomonas tetramitiformis TaxID=36881 RepID=A0AAE0LLP4_9CHLO|nr:hypothetical protein CYMTET_3297 [Cymbomonas tetramitiformis]